MKKDQDHILLITTSSLATNPRLVKEIETLKHLYSCTVLCFEFKDWSLQASQEIIARNPEVDFVVINRKQNLFQTLVSKAVHKLAIGLNPLFKNRLRIAAFAHNDRTVQLWLQLNALKKFAGSQTVMAHNLGAFYPAQWLAKRIKANLQLDVEDFHLGEAIYLNPKWDLHNRRFIMNSAFLRAHAISFASEGIKQACFETLHVPANAKMAVITNAFPKAEFEEPHSGASDPLKLVWFSQNISAHRGLEKVFQTARLLPECEFHLVGKSNSEFIEVMQPANNVILHPPMPQDQLHRFLGTMDIGLALENREADGNRNWCLTNKILAYVQAGLYVLATDTFGQRHFLEEMGPEVGMLLRSDLTEALAALNPKLLEASSKQKRWQKAQQIAWEVEAQKLLHLLK